MQIKIIDNYDSFTHNIKQVLAHCSVCDVEVISYDNFDDLENSNVIVSPGPGLPSDYPKLFELFNRGNKILGICLGHQLVGSFSGGNLKQLPTPVHGEAVEINVVDNECVLFKGLKSFEAGRYHSWYVAETSLIVTAKSNDGLIMGLRNEDQSILSVQFHPESILTPDGSKILGNWAEWLKGNSKNP